MAAPMTPPLGMTVASAGVSPSPRRPDESGPNSARVRGRYGGAAGGQRGAPRTRGGRRIISRPSQRNKGNKDKGKGAWEEKFAMLQNGPKGGGQAGVGSAKENSDGRDGGGDGVPALNAAGDSGSSSGGNSGAGGNSGTASDKSESKQKPLHAQSAYRSRRHLPKNIGRNISKSTLQAISFAEEDHDDVTRQCTSELETRLNEITGEEIKAATSLMRKMRKKCDWYHLAIKQKNETLKDLQKQILRLQQKTDRKDGHRGALRRRADVLRKTLADLTAKYSTQQMNLKIYGHMSKRLMRQVKTTDKSMMHVQQELSLVSKRHKEMEHLHRKLANRKANLHKTRAQLRSKLKDYQDRRTQALLKIERVIQESQLESQLIKDKVRDNENNRQGGSRTDRMAQLYSKHKAKNAQMPKEFREQTQRMQRLEEAFMRIRNSTGLSDVNEIVSKFLSRDEKYEALCNQADEARQKIEVLKAEKSEVQTAIAEFQGSAKGRSTGNRDLYREVDMYDQKLADAQRRHQKQKEKSTRVRLLLEESRITVGRFLKTLSNFGTSSLSISDDPARFVPSISSLPKALQNVKSQVAVMLEQLAVLLAADSEAGNSRPGTRNNRGGSGGSTFLTQSPIVTRTQIEAQRKRSTRLSKSPDEKDDEQMTNGSKRVEEDRQGEGDDDSSGNKDGSGDEISEKKEGDGEVHEGDSDEDESDSKTNIRPVPHMATVLSNPRADKLIFQSLMSTAPDISGQNMRIVRDKSKSARESAVAHLLGLELGPGAGVDDEPDMSGEANRIDEADDLRDPRGWDAHKKRGQSTLDRDRIKHLSRSLVEKRKRRDFREHAAREAAADAIESDDGGGGSENEDWFTNGR